MPCGTVRSKLVGEEAEIREQAGEGRRLVVGVKAARIGQKPEGGGSETGRLEAADGASLGECDAVSGEANDGEDAWLVAAELAAKDGGAGDELLAGELICGRGGAGDEVGNSKAERQQGAVLGRVEEVWRETGGVEGGPEAIAWSTEVVTDRRAVEAWIDAAEQDAKIGSNYITQSLVDSCAKLVGTRSGRRRHCEG